MIIFVENPVLRQNLYWDRSDFQKTSNMFWL